MYVCIQAIDIPEHSQSTDASLTPAARHNDLSEAHDRNHRIQPVRYLAGVLPQSDSHYFHQHFNQEYNRKHRIESLSELLEPRRHAPTFTRRAHLVYCDIRLLQVPPRRETRVRAVGDRSAVPLHVDQIATRVCIRRGCRLPKGIRIRGRRVDGHFDRVACPWGERTRAVAAAVHGLC